MLLSGFLNGRIVVEICRENRSAYLRVLLGFVLVFTALQVGYDLAKLSDTTRHVVDLFTVTPSTVVIDLLDSERGDSRGVVSHIVRLALVRNFGGETALFVFYAGVIAFATTWRYKLRGLVLGTVLIGSFNLAKVVLSYFALVQEQVGWFGVLQNVLGPITLFALGTVFFIVWARRAVPVLPVVRQPVT